MKRHLIDFAPYYPPHVGGVEGYAARLHAEMLELDPDLAVTVITSGSPEDRVAASPAERFQVVRYERHEFVVNFPIPRVGAVRRAISRAMEPGRGACCVMTHTRFFASSYVGMRYADRSGLRHVHVEHGSDHVQAGGGLTRLVARCWDHSLGRRVLRSADARVAVSSAAAEFTRRLGRCDSTVVRRGIDPHPASGVSRAPDDAVVLYVGRLIDAKGVSSLIDALSRLVDVPWQALIIGDGPERATLESLARAQGVAHRCSFLGERNHEAVLDAMGASSVLVNPSLTEGLPTTVLEAAALGLPIVATDVGGTREIMGADHPGLVPAGDVSTLARQIRAVLGDPVAARRRADDLQRSCQEDFSWQSCARAMHELCFPTGSPA